MGSRRLNILGIVVLVVVPGLVLSANPAIGARRVITFTNNTEAAADDLHIELRGGSTVDFNKTTPFNSERGVDGGGTHNLYGGTVADAATATVTLTSGGNTILIRRWWWTRGGNAAGDGARAGDVNGDDGSSNLSFFGGPAQGDGAILVGLGDFSNIFNTTRGFSADQSANSFIDFLDSFEDRGNPLLHSGLRPGTDNSVDFMSTLLGGDFAQSGLFAEPLRPDSAQEFSLHQIPLFFAGDTDLDDDVDNRDLGRSFGHFSGPNPNPLDPKRPFFLDEADGDTDFDGDVDNRDLGRSFGNFTGPGAGNLVDAADRADLIYNTDSGNVKLDASEAAGGVITNFVLGNAQGGSDFNAPGVAAFPFAGPFTTDTILEISQTDGTAVGASGITNLGNIFPTGFDLTGLEAFLTDASYVGELGSGNPELDLKVVPEPSLLADLTGDGFVDFDDLTILLAHWDQEVSAGQGNLVDPLGTPINFQDLTFLLADWTGPGPVGSPEAALGEAAVPEPSSLMLALLATLGLSFGWRRRRRAS